MLTVAISVVAGASTALVIGLRVSDRRSKHADVRRRTVAALRVLGAVVDAGASVPYASDGIAEVLRLRACTYTRRPAGEGDVPVLSPDGTLSGRVHRRDRAGLLLPEVVHVAAGPGRFELVSHPDLSSTIEERVIAATIARVAESSLEQSEDRAHHRPSPPATP